MEESFLGCKFIRWIIFLSSLHAKDMKAIKSTDSLMHRKSNPHQEDGLAQQGGDSAHSTSTERIFPQERQIQICFHCSSPSETSQVSLSTQMPLSQAFSCSWLQHWHFPLPLQMQNFLDTNDLPWKVSVSANQLFLMKNDTGRNFSARALTLDNFQELSSALCFSILELGNDTNLFFITSEMCGQELCARAKYHYYLLF